MQSLDYLEEIHGEVSHGQAPDAAIIWLHGLGADGYDFKPIVQQLALPKDLSIHFVFPHAPVQPVTINQGMNMNAWYDIYEISLDAEEDSKGINASMQSLEALINDKFAHLEPQKILIAGFSQGGALALHTLLHGNTPIGGVIALSTYLPLRELAVKANKQRVYQQEIFLAHGEYDEVLPFQIGDLARGVLLALGANIHWQSYPMAHELCAQQIQHIREWIIKRLA